MTYAAATTVRVDRTRVEIEKLLTRAGASKLGSAVDFEENEAMVSFHMKGAHYRITVPLPRYAGTANYKATAAAVRRHDQAVRTRWRVLLLLLKSKLEAIELGLSSFEAEFLSATVMENGRTVIENMPALLARGLPQLPLRSS